MTNQPAFPVANPFLVKPPLDEADALRLQNGMTLLDYFAAKVLPTVMVEMWEQAHKERSSYTQPVQEIAASFAYTVADAMMAERTKRGL